MLFCGGCDGGVAGTALEVPLALLELEAELPADDEEDEDEAAADGSGVFCGGSALGATD